MNNINIENKWESNASLTPITWLTNLGIPSICWTVKASWRKIGENVDIVTHIGSFINTLTSMNDVIIHDNIRWMSLQSTLCPGSSKVCRIEREGDHKKNVIGQAKKLIKILKFFICLTIKFTNDFSCLVLLPRTRLKHKFWINFCNRKVTK